MYSNHPSRFDLADEALLQDQRVSQEARSVYRMLVKLHVRCQATAWPGARELAAALGSSTRAVRNALTRLADLGYLERKPATRNSRVGYIFPRIDDGLLLSGLAAARHAEQAKYQLAVKILPTLSVPQANDDASPAPGRNTRGGSRLHCACHAPFEAGRSMCTPDTVLALRTHVWQLAAHPETLE